MWTKFKSLINFFNKKDPSNAATLARSENLATQATQNKSASKNEYISDK